jgi:uncharacterized damage-inducible protein DinB
MPATEPQDSGAAFGRALLAEAKRRLIDESVPRIHKCLDRLSEEELWLRPNDQVVSVGNLVLHLLGNVRQYILSGLGGAADHRRRSSEFAETGPIPGAELRSRMDALMAEVERTLGEIDPASLLAMRRVQGFEESGLSILVHVVEHFSYHVGQITYFVKSRQAVDMQYYAGKNLDATS